MLPSCSVESILHNWSCTDGSKGYHSSYLLFNLLKLLPLLTAILKILLSGQLIERAHELSFESQELELLGRSFDLAFRII